MFLLDVFKICINIIYFPYKLIKSRNKITFISRQSNNISLETNLIIEKLKDKNIEIVNISNKLEYNIKSLIENFFLFFKQMYHIASSKIVVIDGYCILVSILEHKKELIVIQTWHANGIVKKIGLQTLDNTTRFKRKLAIKMKMHKKYDYVVSSSDFSSKVFLEAFGVDMKNIIKLGTPILDYLYRGDYKAKKEQIKKEYNLKNKKNIVYMPTIRNHDLNLKDIIENFDFEKYNLILKNHPIQSINNIDNKVIQIKNYTGEEVLSIADYVISDYSNIIFEGILIKKPVFLYLYDIDEYKKFPGLNIDLFKEIPSQTFTNVKNLLEKIYKNDVNFNELNSFVKKHIEMYDGKCTDRIVNFILLKVKFDKK